MEAPLIELIGDVCIDADTDAQCFDANKTVRAHSPDLESDLESNSNMEDEPEVKMRPASRCQSKRGVGTSWEHRRPPTESQASAALEELENI